MGKEEPGGKKKRQMDGQGNRTPEERISHYEEILNRAAATAGQTEAALDSYEQALPELSALEKYYTGRQWKEDCAADEAGQLPEGLKRGVLSQDGVWNLLERYREIRERIRALAGAPGDPGQEW